MLIGRNIPAPHGEGESSYLVKRDPNIQAVVHRHILSDVARKLIAGNSAVVIQAESKKSLLLKFRRD
jgi:hypothetical protein